MECDTNRDENERDSTMGEETSPGAREICRDHVGEESSGGTRRIHLLDPDSRR